MKTFGTLYILSAPSGGGKTSLVKALLAEVPNIIVSVSYTTRPKRPAEQEGVNYNFITEQEFSRLITKNKFLEYANVYSHHYGTSREWVENKLKAGTDVILEIDWQGAQQIRKLMPEVVSIFILPPSREVLLQRLQARKQDNEDVIAKRMTLATNEISHFKEYDYLVINDDFQTALMDLRAIVHARRLLTPLQQEKNQVLLADLLA